MDGNAAAGSCKKVEDRESSLMPVCVKRYIRMKSLELMDREKHEAEVIC